MTGDDRSKAEPIHPEEQPNQGVSAEEPAEGADDVSPPTEGSPKG